MWREPRQVALFSCVDSVRCRSGVVGGWFDLSPGSLSPHGRSSRRGLPKAQDDCQTCPELTWVIDLSVVWGGDLEGKGSLQKPETGKVPIQTAHPFRYDGFVQLCPDGGSSAARRTEVQIL